MEHVEDAGLDELRGGHARDFFDDRGERVGAVVAVVEFLAGFGFEGGVCGELSNILDGGQAR